MNVCYLILSCDVPEVAGMLRQIPQREYEIPDEATARRLANLPGCLGIAFVRKTDAGMIVCVHPGIEQTLVTRYREAADIIFETYVDRVHWICNMRTVLAHPGFCEDLARLVTEMFLVA